MDILVKGPGEVKVCLVDRAGKTMLRETLRVFGSQSVTARRPIELEAIESASRREARAAKRRWPLSGTAKSLPLPLSGHHKSGYHAA